MAHSHHDSRDSLPSTTSTLYEPRFPSQSPQLHSLDRDHDQDPDASQESITGMLADRLSKSMRIVSEKGRMSMGGEEGEVEGYLGEEGEGDLSRDEGGGVNEIASPSVKARVTPTVASLAQPAVQPRMNRIALARLTSASSTTPTSPQSKRQSLQLHGGLHKPGSLPMPKSSSNASLSPGGPASNLSTRCATPNSNTNGDQKPAYVPASERLRLRKEEAEREKKRREEAGENTEERMREEKERRKAEVISARRRTIVMPTSLQEPVATPRSNRSSILRSNLAQDNTFVSPLVNVKSKSRLEGITKEEIKEKEKEIFAGVPGHSGRKGLGMMAVVEPAVTPRSNRAADLRMNPNIAITPSGPAREFKAKPLPNLYNNSGVRGSGYGPGGGYEGIKKKKSEN